MAFNGIHPLFPKPDELPTTTFDAVKPQPAWTKRQQETEERIGQKLLWSKEQAKMIWKKPAVYTPLAEKIDAKLAKAILRGKDYFANYFTAYASADACSTASTFAQCGLDMTALDQILNHLGLPLSFADRRVQARIYSPGAVVHDNIASGYSTRAGSQSLKYTTALNLNWLPDTKAALLAVDFKTLGPLLSRNGAGMGVWSGDGFISDKGRNMQLAHGGEDSDAVSAKFGDPVRYRPLGNGVFLSEWTGADAVRIAELVLGDPKDTSFINARKYARITAMIARG